jgi:hypothetical protein
LRCNGVKFLWREGFFALSHHVSSDDELRSEGPSFGIVGDVSDCIDRRPIGIISADWSLIDRL